MTLTFMALVHPQAGQQGDGLGVEAGTTTQPLGQIRERQGRHAPGVIGKDCRSIGSSSGPDLWPDRPARLKPLPLRPIWGL